ncbi:MAG: hypothetical protein ACRC1Z_19435 [Waterburya sp.]
MSAIFIPGYIQVIERTPTGWFQTQPKQVINLSDNENFQAKKFRQYC